MDLQLHDSTVLITGASGGIGGALAEVFAAEGARLVLTGHRHIAELRAWAADQPWADRALCVEVDVTDPQAQAAAAAAAVERFGRLDVAIANAGVWPVEHAPVHALDVDRARRTIEVNLLGSFWTARAFLGALARTGPHPAGRGAALLFIGSTAGAFGEAGHADYAAAKAGLNGLMRSVKNEIVHVDPYGRCNTLQPGWTVTHMARPALDQPGVIAGVCRTMPLRQLARSVDIARTAAFLCSDAARHVSGEVVTVAGGMEGRTLWDAADVDEAAVRRRLDPA